MKARKPKLWYINVYHEPDKVDEAAYAWKENGVMAVGWSSLGDLKSYAEEGWIPHKPLRRLYFNVRRGDYVFAYTRGKTIAYVGKVKGRYKYNRKNIVGSKNGFDYAHQIKVRWFNEPYFFSAYHFGKHIAEQLGRRGVTLTEVKTKEDVRNLVRNIRKISNDISGKNIRINEDTVKAGIVKYLHTNLNKLERGLKVTTVEHGIKKLIPDFIAEDSMGRPVLIECKGIAEEDAIDQINRYLRKWKGQNPRGFVIAFRISDKCRAKAKLYPKIKLFEVDLLFTRK